ncbi:AKR_HP2_G0023570.mRNA.1.CDS.1 [Saccharomyces cerevisiae]|nr:AKR_HP2_G0023570.mRNA.1.CDS.1 [Saccharomyces cerevisiae]CAI6473247.1 AKR_HP2_G0023570.mRNA.1.CDS.1 [Saccharomyces cerevisiae]
MQVEKAASQNNNIIIILLLGRIRSITHDYQRVTTLKVLPTDNPYSVTLLSIKTRPFRSNDTSQFTQEEVLIKEIDFKTKLVDL